MSKWSGRYFTKIRGFAIGQRLPPVIAVCFMGKLEGPVLSQQPLLYCRYIDDCCVITCTQSQMDACFRLLNEQLHYIKMRSETPRESWVPSFNTQLKLWNGMVYVKWYRKQSSKNIVSHARSAQPVTVKRAVIRNMFETAIEVCSGEAERQQYENLAPIIASENGHVSREKQHLEFVIGAKAKNAMKNFLFASSSFRIR